MKKDKYRNFRHLSRHEVRGRDFAIEYQDRHSSVLVMAPHGGRIEPFTTPLARLIAGQAFSFYTFRGIRGRKNSDLHITSHRFDEPVALEAAGGVEIVLAIHGARSVSADFIMVGGRAAALGKQISDRLRADGFLLHQPEKGLRALHPLNICNRGRSGTGVQLELSAGLRRSLKADTGLQRRFTDSVRKALFVYSSFTFVGLI